MNQNIVITGGTKGLGLNIAKFFLELNNYNVIVLGRNKKNLNKLLLNKNFYFLKCDLSKYLEIKKIFNLIDRKFKHIDILINNASIFENQFFHLMRPESINKMVDINLKGYIFCTYFFFQQCNKDFARIINISSVAGERGIRNQSVYSATKHGVNGFFDAVAQEVINKNIQVTTLCPGGIDTTLWTKSNPYPGEDYENLLEPNDIIQQIDYLIKQNKNVVVKKVISFPSTEWH